MTKKIILTTNPITTSWVFERWKNIKALTGGVYEQISHLTREQRETLRYGSWDAIEERNN